MTSASNAHCAATTKDGNPCQAYALEGDDFCFWHSPKTVGQRRKARSKGGRAKAGRDLTVEAEPVKIASMDDVLPLLERTVNDVLRLENSISRGRTVGYLAGIMLKAFEMSDLAERVRMLEEVLTGRK